MPLINYYGLLIVIVIMIPNTIYAKFCPEGFANLYTNKFVLTLEQIGRFGCFGFVVLQLPYVCLGYLINSMTYMFVVGILCVLYCIGWIIFWNKSGKTRILYLSILPSIMFLCAGILSLNIPLICAALIFGPCHIKISYMNEVLKQNIKNK